MTRVRVGNHVLQRAATCCRGGCLLWTIDLKLAPANRSRLKGLSGTVCPAKAGAAGRPSTEHLINQIDGEVDRAAHSGLLLISEHALESLVVDVLPVSPGFEPVSDDRRFQLLVNAVRDYAIFMLDPQGIVSSWNSGAQRFKGYKAVEIIGQHFSRFYTEEDRQAGVPQQALATAVAEGKYETEGWRVR